MKNVFIQEIFYDDQPGPVCDQAQTPAQVVEGYVTLQLVDDPELQLATLLTNKTCGALQTFGLHTGASPPPCQLSVFPFAVQDVVVRIPALR